MTDARFSSKSMVKYAILPRIVPRAGDLFLSGFRQVAYLMAHVYRGVRLLPENHPFLKPSSAGQYNIMQVIAAAAQNLEFRRENIDQIIVFFALLLGLVLLAVQTVVLLGSLFMPLAHASSMLSFQAYFGTSTYGGLPVGHSQDIAFILLDRVFGVPGIFESCVSTATNCYASLPDLTFDTVTPVYKPAVFPWPYHTGLHTMLQFYSVGLLVVACFIIIYFIIVLVAETAQTGTPFGKRFNSVWAPLRLVMALGLLIPITYGLNSAQYITLYVAKWGSNFATNGWFSFNAGVQSWGAPQAIQLVAKPQTPDVDGLLQFMMLAHACKALEEGAIKMGVPATVTGGPTSCPNIDSTDDGYNRNDTESEIHIDAYVVRFDITGSNDARRLVSTPYDDGSTNGARGFSDNGDITIRFGDRGCDYTRQLGRVFPTCGEIVLPMVNPSSLATEAGARVIQQGYYETIRTLWGEYGNGAGLATNWKYKEFCEPSRVDSNFTAAGFQGDMEIRKKAIAYVQQAYCKADVVENREYGAGGTFTPAAADFLALPGEDWGTDASTHYHEGEGVISGPPHPNPLGPSPAYPGAMANSPFEGGISVIAENIIRKGIVTQINAIANGAFELPAEQLARGWAGAGMWYNHIARLNGGLTAAAITYPTPSRYPIIMESVLAELRQNNQNMTPADQFNPNLSGRQQISLKRAGEVDAAVVLNRIFTYWGNNKSIHKPPTGNAIFDFINNLFGTKGLFSLDDPQNAQVNPLALLSSLGKSLVEASIRNLAGATGGMVVGAISGAFKFTPGEAAADAISGFLFSIASATLTAGIVLYYVLPFLPFIYFFFAVGNWIKGIFEAMVGVPLWALAHIRIDGNGLPGDAAMNGYYMLFEIFLRPILILFGLLASVTVFAAMATVLNGIWPLATKNLGGANYDLKATTGWVESARGPVDQLFFTVMYAVILYIMALSSFKLIDLIPAQIMRWLGTSVSTFSDLTGDAAANLTQYTSMVGQQMSGQAIGGLRSMGGAMKDMGKAIGPK